MPQPSALLLRTAGTNCDRELATAFERAGATVALRHLNEVLAQPALLDGHAILAVPGGFSYGDDIASGRIFANQLVHHLADALARFVQRGGLVLGVCNGFQILVKCGLLPDGPGRLGRQNATLTHNDSARFECRWASMGVPASTRCVWTRPLAGQTFALPVAHGEGKFVAPEADLARLADGGQIAVQYVGDDGRPTAAYPANPNGSLRAIAGVCDSTGRVFGLMPHPERYAEAAQAPGRPVADGAPAGLVIIQAGVAAARQA